MIEAVHELQYSDEEANEIAYQEFCTMAILHIPRIAAKVGRTKDQVTAWRTEQNWDCARQQVQAQLKAARQTELEKLLKKIPTLEKSSVKTIAQINDIMATLHKMMSEKMAATDANKVTEAFERMENLKKKTYESIKV